MSDVLVNMPTVLSSVALVILVAVIVRRITDIQTAFLSAILLSFFTPYIKASFLVYGYVETMALCFLAIFLAMKIICPEAPGGKGAGVEKSGYIITLMSALVGVVSGLAVYGYDFALVFIMPLAVWCFFNIGRFRPAGAMAAIIGFFIGWSITLKHIIHKKMGVSAHSRWIHSEGHGDYFDRLEILITNALPRFFSTNIHLYREEIQLFSLVMFWLFIVFLLYYVYNLKRPAGGVRKPVVLMVLIAGFIPYYLLLISMFSYSLRFARYLLPLSPFIVFTVAYSSISMFRRGRAGRVLSTILLGAFVLCLASGLDDMRRCRNNTCRDISGYNDLISFLRLEGVKGIYTDYETKWPVAFYSGEEIVGSDYSFVLMPRFLPYEEEMKKTEDFAYVFPVGEENVERVRECLDKKGLEYDREQVGGFEIIYNTPERCFPIPEISPDEDSEKSKQG